MQGVFANLVASVCLLAGLLFLTVSPVQGKSGGDLPFYDATLQDAALPPGTLLKAEKIALPPLYRAKAWRILYSTRDFMGRPLVSSGMVVIPTVQQKQPGPRKIVA